MTMVEVGDQFRPSIHQIHLQVFAIRNFQSCLFLVLTILPQFTPWLNYSLFRLEEIGENDKMQKRSFDLRPGR